MSARTSTLTVLSVLAGLIGTVPAQATARDITSPPAFDDDLAATITGGQDLWLFVTGEQGPRRSKIKAFVRAKGRWRNDRTLQPAVSPDYAAVSASLRVGPKRTTPCLGYVDERERSELQCLTDDGWGSMVEPGAFDGLGTLTDISASGSHLVVLLERWHGARVDVSVLRVGAHGSDRVGSPIELPQAIAAFSEGPGLAVTVNELNSGKRYVIASDDGIWHRYSGILRSGEGPMIGGGVSEAGSQFIPVNDASKSNWTFSVFSSEVRGAWKSVTPRPLSSGTGDAQGELARAGNHVYAAWQEQSGSGGRLKTRIELARYVPDKGRFMRPKTLWKGKAIGPGSLGVASHRGQDFALFMRASEDGRGLRATVTRVR